MGLNSFSNLGWVKKAAALPAALPLPGNIATRMFVDTVRDSRLTPNRNMACIRALVFSLAFMLPVHAKIAVALGENIVDSVTTEDKDPEVTELVGKALLLLLNIAVCISQARVAQKVLHVRKINSDLRQRALTESTYSAAQGGKIEDLRVFASELVEAFLAYQNGAPAKFVDLLMVLPADRRKEFLEQMQALPLKELRMESHLRPQDLQALWEEIKKQDPRKLVGQEYWALKSRMPKLTAKDWASIPIMLLVLEWLKAHV